MSDQTCSVAQPLGHQPVCDLYSASPCTGSQGGQKQNLNVSKERASVYQEAVRAPAGRNPPSSAFYHSGLARPTEAAGTLKNYGVYHSQIGVCHIHYPTVGSPEYSTPPACVPQALSEARPAPDRHPRVAPREPTSSPPPCTLAAGLGYRSGEA